MQYRKTGTIDLSGRQLTEVPRHLWRNRSLRVLNLFRNKLKMVPATSGKFEACMY